MAYYVYSIRISPIDLLFNHYPGYLLVDYPVQSTLFARFLFLFLKRRLTIHKWLWPLTPLVHLRPHHTRSVPESVSVSLGSE